VKTASNRASARLLQAGSKPDDRGDMGSTALHYAAMQGNIPIVEALLNYGADINASGEFPIWSSVSVERGTPGNAGSKLAPMNKGHTNSPINTEVDRRRTVARVKCENIL
jgi:ankyrin repeat protein